MSANLIARSAIAPVQINIAIIHTDLAVNTLVRNWI